MSKFKRLFVVPVVLICMMFAPILTACGGGDGGNGGGGGGQDPTSYTVTYKDWNGATLWTDSFLASNLLNGQVQWNIRTNKPSRTGYEFLGWTSDLWDGAKYSDGFGPMSMGQMPNLTGNITLTASYSAVDYVYILTDEYGYYNVNPYTVNDLPITLSEPPDVPEHLVFQGWYTNEDFIGSPITQITTVGVHTFYAKLTQIFSIRFYDWLWDAPNTSWNWQEVYKIENVFADTPVNFVGETPTLESWYPHLHSMTFVGWGTSVYNLTGEQDDLEPYEGTVYLDGHLPNAGSGATNYFARYEKTIRLYTVSFRDWDGREIKTEQVEYGQSVTAPENPTREYYDFYIWDISAFRYESVTEDLIITAIYTPIRWNITYVIDLENLNDFSIPTGYQYTIEGAVGDLFAPSPHTGYAFLGWYDNPEFTGEPVFTNTKPGWTGHITLYGRVALGATVTINYNDGSEPVILAVGIGDIVPQPQDPEPRDGWRFNGWSYDFNNPIMETITINALWSERLTVTFEPNGGTGTNLDPREVWSGDTIYQLRTDWFVAARITVTRAGYFFDGWYREETFVNRVVHNTPIQGNWTLYAKWIPAELLNQITTPILTGANGQSLEYKYYLQVIHPVGGAWASNVVVHFQDTNNEWPVATASLHGTRIQVQGFCGWRNEWVFWELRYFGSQPSTWWDILTGQELTDYRELGDGTYEIKVIQTYGTNYVTIPSIARIYLSAIGYVKP